MVYAGFEIKLGKAWGMEEIQKSLDGLGAKLDTKASKAQLEEIGIELRAELASKASKTQLEELGIELRAELATKAQLEDVRVELHAALETKATVVQVDMLTEMVDLMRQSLDQIHHRMDRMEERQVSQDLKMEEFRSEVRVFGEGIKSNRGRIEKLESKSA